MAAAFSRTMRSLESAHPRRGLWLLAGVLVLLTAWGAWMLLAPITLYAATDAAHLEAADAATLAAPASGQVIAIQASVGRPVQRGQVLFEIAGGAGPVPVLAPRDGVLAADADLRPGTFVQMGDPLGTIIGPGPLKIVADFAPGAALGRIHPGQVARFRVAQGQLAQVASLPARVAQVAGEARYGRVRVELALAPGGAAAALQHGMPGSVEIEIGQITPAGLLLGAAGVPATGAP